VARAGRVFMVMNVFMPKKPGPSREVTKKARPDGRASRFVVSVVYAPPPSVLAASGWKARRNVAPR
jgi:hypothetical protein